MSTLQALARIFYRPSDILGSEWAAQNWGYIVLLFFMLSYASVIIAFIVVARIHEVTPTIVFLYSVFIELAILVLIDALYLRVISSILGLELKVDY